MKDLFFIVEASLSWSCFEQSCLWQLIDAEETPIEMLVGILGQLTQKKHTETLNHLMLQIRAERYSSMRVNLFNSLVTRG